MNVTFLARNEMKENIFLWECSERDGRCKLSTSSSTTKDAIYSTSQTQSSQDAIEWKSSQAEFKMQ